jgi:hypothetical protein
MPTLPVSLRLKIVCPLAVALGANIANAQYVSVGGKYA